MKAAALIFLAGTLSWSQCAMCFRTAESQTRARAEVLNKGILVMLIPLIASVSVIAMLGLQAPRADDRDRRSQCLSGRGRHLNLFQHQPAFHQPSKRREALSIRVPRARRSPAPAGRQHREKN